MYNTSQCSRGIPNKSDSEQKQDNFYYSSPKAATDMGVSSSESHDLTAFYEMLSASFGVLSQNTGFYPSLDRIIETTLGPLNLGPGGGSYNEPKSPLHPTPSHSAAGTSHPIYITAAQIEYDQNKDRGKIWLAKESQSRKGPDKTLEVDIALNRVPLQSTAGLSQLITVDTAGGDYEQRKEEGDSEGHSKSAREVYAND